MSKYSDSDTYGFSEAVVSLKKYRRPELIDEKGNDLLDILYTDLLPNDQVIKTCLKPNTTFIIGRKGTGKSTIFLKLQKEINKNNNNICCYIDTKTIFEASQSEYVNPNYLNGLKIPKNSLDTYLIERTFIQHVLQEIRLEIDKSSESIIDKIKRLVGVDKTELVNKKIYELEQLIENNEAIKEIEIPMLKSKVVTLVEKEEQAKKTSLETGIRSNLFSFSTDGGVGANINASDEDNTKISVEHSKEFSEIFLGIFKIRDVISKIKDILSILGIKNLYILLDDFSEIDDQSMKIFVDVLLAPLNNWSNDFIKFKVAAYPHRVYYGKIDIGKIDIIDLDFYELYSEFSRTSMEEKAIDFTRRLIENRISYFTNQPVQMFFDNKEDMHYYYELIFQISMNVPRIIGYILLYCYESNIIYDKPINRIALEAAATKYYQRAIKSFFGKTTYSMMALEEKIDILQLEELLQKIVDNQKLIKKKIVEGVYSGESYDKSNPYTSHFNIQSKYEYFVRTLELNFFITKYEELKDRDMSDVSVYALNYGLCHQNNIRWGKPKDDRKYFISRPFNFSKLLEDFLNESKRIECISCKRTYSIKDFDSLKFNKMQCIDCHAPVKIVSLADNIKKEIDKINYSDLLDAMEYDILYEVYHSQIQLRAKDIAEELDCSYQLIGKKAKKLIDKKLLLKNQIGKKYYSLTEEAIKIYFSN